ncbi:DNA helicase [Vermiconidia calcicola]|uniref:DNA helicase n=1 Tax=Vermiconidia calcicola TaxID=1690605 RepID=A0ACC3NE49_9PEZI|nr:DNA helicase [Vermiconidia calcicola]
MGRHAKDVPTFDNVDRAIAKLKPRKRGVWQEEARARGWCFEEYVIARIKANIEHRDGKRGNCGDAARVEEASWEHGLPARIDEHREELVPTASGGLAIAAAEEASPEAAGCAVSQDVGLHDIQTQQLEEELARRKDKRKRRESLEEDRRGSHSALEHRPKIRKQGGAVCDIQPWYEPPPSGGAASRANPSFTATASFMTAHEARATSEASFDSTAWDTAEEAPSASATAPSPTALEDSIPVIASQDWRDFLDSSQANAGTAYFARRPDDAPCSTYKQEQQDSTDRRRFDVNNVPSGATKVWCIRKGLVPGFHFTLPYLPSPDETRHEYWYQAFDFNDSSMRDVLQEAVDYMNHRPEDCKPTYGMCYVDCTQLSDRTKRTGHKGPPMAQETDKGPSMAAEIQPTEVDWVTCKTETTALSVPPDLPAHDDADMQWCIEHYSLCDEQIGVLELAARGHNLFYTGAAGTGKSQVLRAMVKYLQLKRVTAMSWPQQE